MLRQTTDMLSGISEAVSAIAQMSLQMAAASAETTKRMQQIAAGLHELVVRFKR